MALVFTAYTSTPTDQRQLMTRFRAPVSTFCTSAIIDSPVLEPVSRLSGPPPFVAFPAFNTRPLFSFTPGGWGGGVNCAGASREPSLYLYSTRSGARFLSGCVQVEGASIPDGGPALPRRSGQPRKSSTNKKPDLLPSRSCKKRPRKMNAAHCCWLMRGEKIAKSNI